MVLIILEIFVNSSKNFSMMLINSSNESPESILLKSSSNSSTETKSNKNQNKSIPSPFSILDY
jgi:hypothetical protein